MIVELITIGDELLDGRRIDTNTAWLGRKLSSLGIRLRFRQTVTDRVEDIVDAFQKAKHRSNIILTSGGLGPTSDDLTFEAVAKAVNQKLIFHPKVFEKIQEKFEKRGLKCPESNRRQAFLPKGAVSIENERGTAPALRLDWDGTLIFCLPGVPNEMTHLFEKAVQPELIQQRIPNIILKERIYKFVGIPESYLEEVIEGLKFSNMTKGDVRIAYTASYPQIDVTLLLAASHESEIMEFFQYADKQIQEKLGEYLVAKDEETLESRIVKTLTKRNFKLAVAESLTGGLLAAKIIDVSGSSKVFERGFVTYSNESKKALLNVSKETLNKNGAVSEICALEMAKGAQRNAKVDVAVSTTGIAGPTGGTQDKPIGLTYIACVGPGFENVKRYQFRWDRNRNRMLAVYEAMRSLIRFLENKH